MRCAVHVLLGLVIFFFHVCFTVYQWRRWDEF